MNTQRIIFVLLTVCLLLNVQAKAKIQADIRTMTQQAENMNASRQRRSVHGEMEHTKKEKELEKLRNKQREEFYRSRRKPERPESAKDSIRLKHLVVNTRTSGTHPTKEGLSAAEKESSLPIVQLKRTQRDTSPYIVQFTDKIQPAWKDRLIAEGVVLHGYLPENAYVCEMTQATASRMSNHDNVKWIGRYKPDYKTTPFLKHLADEHKSTKKRTAAGEDESPATQTNADYVKLNIRLFSTDDLDFVCKEIKRLGGTVLLTKKSTQTTKIRALCPLEALSQLASLAEVRYIDEHLPYQVMNNVAVTVPLMNVETCWNTHGLTGEGQIIGHADSGIDSGDFDDLHPAFENKIKAGFSWWGPEWNDLNGHGTHTAGSIVGNEDANWHFRGVAYRAQLVTQRLAASGSYQGYIYTPSDLGDLFEQTYQLGARIHSDSWGSNANGQYTDTCEDVDRYIWENPDMLVIFAAGNAGVDYSPRNGVVDGGSVGCPATAKNVLAVGAAETDRAAGCGGLTSYTWDIFNPPEPWSPRYWSPIRDDLISTAADGTNQGMAAFSSRGPTDDGRIKPDIVAPGTDVISCRSRRGITLEGENNPDGWGEYSDPLYSFSGGTSMATPLTAGAAALVREYYTDRRKVSSPSAALMKATLMVGARSLYPGQYGTGPAQEIPTARPNNVEGWGHVDLSNTLFPDDESLRFYDGHVISAPGEEREYEIKVDEAGGSLSLLLVYTDAPASPVASVQLVNDLDLRVITPSSQTNYPNHLIAPDRINNVEGIDIDVAEQGIYRVLVSGYNIPEGPQPYALVVHGSIRSWIMQAYCETLQPPNVKALVDSSVSISNVTLRYRLSGGNWADVDMAFEENEESGTRYGVNLSVLPPDTISDYDVVVTRTDGETDSSGIFSRMTPAWVVGQSHEFQSPEDLNPVIVRGVVASGAISISAIETEYRVNGGAYQTESMSYQETTGTGDIYVGTIPAQAPGDMVDYQVTAASGSYKHIGDLVSYQLPYLEADFAVSKTNALSGEVLQFSDTSSQGTRPITQWQWSFGEGETSGVQHPQSSYSTAGTYTVSLTVTDALGNSLEEKASLIEVRDSIARYVAPAGSSSPASPYTSWETAANTIQDVIDVSRDWGDEIVVAEGSYTSMVRMNGKNVYLHSTDPSDSRVVKNTIIDGQQHRTSCISFSGDESELCIIDGLTIANADTASSGGGIRGNGCRAEIRNCIITNNSAYYYMSWSKNGGGIYDCDGFIHDCIIENNYSQNGGGIAGCDGIISNNIIRYNRADIQGGGIHASFGGLIIDNKIYRNSARQVQGGAISGNIYGCYASIIRNEIFDNEVEIAWGSGGGGIAGCDGIISENLISNNNSLAGNNGGIYGCDGWIKNNTIVDNQAAVYGGGIGECMGVIQNNIIARNHAGDEGGGITWCHGRIANNTIVNNTAGNYGGGLDASAGIIENCLIWGNSSPIGAQVYGNADWPQSAPYYSCVQEDGSGIGNTSSDPLLDVDGYHILSSLSPCVNAGRVPKYLNVEDIDGEDRYASGLIDIGADEWVDLDLDCMADYWEKKCGLNTISGSHALCDTDGDGMVNLAEYQAGTNPNDDADDFSIQSASRNGTALELTLSWDTKVNCLYTVQYTDDLKTGQWIDIPEASSLPGNGQEVFINLNASSSLCRIYRIKANDSALSQNMVGYTHYSLEAGKTVYATFPFESLGGDVLHTSDVFGNQLSAGSVIYAWNSAEHAWTCDFLSGRAGWMQDIEYSPGTGFAVRPGGSETYDVLLIGKVPNVEIFQWPIAQNLTLLGYPYPITMRFSDTFVSTKGIEGDKLFIWDIEEQGWTGYTNSLQTGWGSATNLILTPHMGFWYQSAALNYICGEAGPYGIEPIGFADDDNDGMPNYRERLTGTDPLNADDVFVIRSIQADGSVMSASIEWNTKSGLLYDFEESDNLMSNVWQAVEGATDIPGTGNPMSVDVPVTGSKTYQVRVNGKWPTLNAVGCVVVDVIGGELELAVMNLVPMAENTISDLIGHQVPKGSVVYYWDRWSNRYIKSVLKRKEWRSPLEIYRGDAFWLKTSGHGTNSVLLAGEIPYLYNHAYTTTLSGFDGADFAGYPYPVQMPWMNTMLAQDSQDGDILCMWNMEAQKYDVYTKNPANGWGEAESLNLQLGRGFFFDSNGRSFDWIETVPYSLNGQ